MRTRRAVGGATLAGLLAAPGQAFWMPLPVHDHTASAHAASLLDNAQDMLEIAGSMQNTLENVEASIDAGFAGHLSKVPLPGGWAAGAGRKALLTGQVPYATLASGVLDTFELNPETRAMIATGVRGLSRGTSPIEIAVALGVERLDDATGPEVEAWMRSAGAGSTPDQHLASVIRLAQTHAAGAPTGSGEADSPEWVNEAVAAGSGAARGWIAQADGAPPWMVNLGMRHAGAPVRTALGAASHAVSPAVMDIVGGGEGGVMERIAGDLGTPPAGSEIMLASVRTAAAALAGHEDASGDGVALGEAAREYVARAHVSAPMSARVAHTPHDVETVVWRGAEAGVFDGHIEMRTVRERNESAAEERERASLEAAMMAGRAERAMIGGTGRRKAAEDLRTLMARVSAHRYDAKAGSAREMVDKHAGWALDAMGAAGEGAPWRDIDHEGARRSARRVAELGLGALNEEAARAAQSALPAGAAARARRVCAQLNRLGMGSDLCRWVEGASAPGRSATTGSEANARRWDRVNAALMRGEEAYGDVGREGVSKGLESRIRKSAEARRPRTGEEAAQAQIGCLMRPRTEYEPWPGALPARACPGNPDVPGDVTCPIGTPGHGDTRWRVAPTDALHVAGPSRGPGRVTHIDVLRVKRARAHYVLASGVEAMAAAASAQSASERRRRQAGEMLKRLEACEDLLCELRVMGDAARLEAEEAAQATHLELSRLDLRIAESIAESHLWRH